MIFDYTCSTDYLRAKIEENSHTYGYKKKLAQEARCQPSYLSQVLAGQAFLSPDHAMGVASFWKLAPLETDYFIELVYMDRADDSRLTELISRRLDRLRQENADFSKRFQKNIFSDDVAKPAIYYSAWYYTAIHVLTTIPAYASVEAISARLGLPAPVIREALSFLDAAGLVVKKESKWLSSNQNIHVPKNSPFHLLNHQHWRMRSILKSGLESSSITYTGLYSLSRTDLKKLRQLILDFIQKTREVVEPSAPEELICFNCDLFEV